ncbi:hypothetical protein [Chitinophaga japonensis]|uniref:Uncharacterized protein n=1 Tax=Chitinophaga japonensis TaxID=104662 RepID=A0A562TEU4_CHIJA|nr:hypothetical protein [Chitinophaga japonensis]TWI91784.1 hypothetical protein LX66_1164 [Chitinophaga japonensis]
MPYKYFWPLVITGSLVLGACKKEKSREGDAPLPPVSTCGYAPYTDGSVYNYENVNAQTSDTTRFTVTVTGDSLISGISYKKLASDTATTYNRCDNGSYYQMVKGISFEGYTADSVMSIYLKDNVAIGSSWTDTVVVRDGADEQTVILTYSITQKGATKRVYDLDFTDVIAVKLDASVRILGTPVSLGTLVTNYYAEGVGLIQADQAQDTTRLRSYNIQ